MKKLLFAALLTLSGCGSIQTAIDCKAICSRYQSCFDTSYDVGGCESRCESHASNDTAYRNQAAECIDGISCTSAAFTCGSQCSSIVP